MAKRLTDTNKWQDEWFLSLNNDHKIIWLYLLDVCDCAGIIKKNFKMLNFCCNTNITEKKFNEVFAGRVVDCDTFYFIPKFLKFQYPQGLNSQKPVIASVRRILKEKKLLEIIRQSLGNDYLMITEPLPNDCLMIKESLPNDSVIIKEKEKDNYNNNNIYNNNNNNNQDLEIIHIGGVLGGGKSYSLKEVLDAAYVVGVPADKAEEFFHHYNAQGWKRGNGQIIENLPSMLQNWKLEKYRPLGKRRKVDVETMIKRKTQELFGGNDNAKFAERENGDTVESMA